jgi:FKBP-type peptidyl-prolyl cis-trans isomerase FkpA
MKFMSLVGTVCLALAASACHKAPAALEVDKGNDDQKALYALGRMIGGNVTRLHLSDEELAFVTAGVVDGAQDKPLRAGVDMQKAGQRLAAMEHDRMTKAAAPEKEAGRAFVDKEAGEKDARRLPSGVLFRPLQEGKGPSPAADDQVAVNYVGTLRNGTEFDSSYKKGHPINFKVNGVIPCWTEALQLMKVGGKARILCPSDVAYGDGGSAQIPGGATLAFDVELLAIAPRETAAAAPAAPQSRK